MSKFRTEPLLPSEVTPQPTHPAGVDVAPAAAENPRAQLFTQLLPGAAGAPLSHRPTERAPGDASTFAVPRGAPRALLTGRILASKYELTTRLGVGGMGEVYRAVHLTLGIDVAVKVMHPHVAAIDEYVRRFRREAYASSLLHHRHVVRVFDFGEDDGLLFIVMEHLRGETLSRWLARATAPPPLERCAEILAQVIDAFDAAHAAGIVHRDLKPENVFLTIEDDGMQMAKVVDFGLAHVDDYRDAGPTLTKADLVSGTPEYMSPEQCRSLAVGPSTDIYALGCLLTDMLQLAPPFAGNAVEVMTQQMFVPPPPLKRPAGAEPVPPLLERLRLSLLAKAIESRPRDVREVKRLLVEAMSQDATSQRLPPRKNEVAASRGDARSIPPPAPLTPPSERPAPSGMLVQLVRLTARDDGLTVSCATGLAVQGIALVESFEGAEHAARVTVLDAGDDIEVAAAWLRQKNLRIPVLVCLADVTTERMNTLIAAGAKDIVPYPVTSDVVARKIRRAARIKVSG